MDKDNKNFLFALKTENTGKMKDNNRHSTYGAKYAFSISQLPNARAEGNYITYIFIYIYIFV